tara:strand:- start:67554 stop:68690 length:1137 start_codon:yes stop_codon:yes gene_type:complete
MKSEFELIAVLPQGLEDEGAKELLELGAYSIRKFNRSVSFLANLDCFYRVHLQARLPFRFLRHLAEFECNGPKSLYLGVKKAVDWDIWLPPEKSFRVNTSGRTFGLTHTHFSSLQVKNAIIDLQREKFGKRSDINLIEPHVALHLHLGGGRAYLSLETYSESLHKRGYRPAMGIAPLKENLAAGLIRLSNWPDCLPIADPLCGAGTLLIEAASIAIGLSPGLNRSFLFENWHDFDGNLFLKEKDLAKKNQKFTKKLPTIIGCEQNLEIANQAKENIRLAGLEGIIEIKNSNFLDFQLPIKQGFLVCNPPYGKRLGNEEDLKNLYQKLGDFCKANASGWQFWILNGNPNLSRFLRMKAAKKIPVNNGGIDCRWLQYLIN